MDPKNFGNTKISAIIDKNPLKERNREFSNGRNAATFGDLVFD